MKMSKLSEIIKEQNRNLRTPCHIGCRITVSEEEMVTSIVSKLDATRSEVLREIISRGLNSLSNELAEKQII